MSAPETAPVRPVSGSRILTGLTFALAGPGMTGFVVGLLAVLMSPKESDTIAWGLIVGVFGIFWSFVYCAIPAAIIAVLAALGSRFIRDDRVWLAVCPIVGGAVSAAYIVLTRYNGEGLIGLTALQLYAVCGAVASLACAAICLAFRPRTVRSA